MQATVPKAEMSAETLNQSALLITGGKPDGRSSSLTAPNGPASSYCERAKRQSHQSDRRHNLEMHGTGTSRDRLRLVQLLMSCAEAFQSRVRLHEMPQLEAAKTRAGHCEPGAG